MSDVAKPRNPEDDWKIWLVLNPATWLIPTLIAVLATAILVHVAAFSLEDQGWSAPAPEAVVVVEPEAAAS
jgi:light-harvesting protein B-800-850 alpha chain